MSSQSGRVEKINRSANRRQRVRFPASRLLIVCTSCDLTLGKLAHLQSHSKFHDDNLACYLCVCSTTGDTDVRTFGQIKAHCLTEHKKFVFLCPFCQILFTSAASLAVHERIHTGERPYACPLCEYKSAQTSTLKQHVRTHTGDKPYVCHLCDYSSAQSGKLYRHLSRHPGFECSGPQAAKHPCGECRAIFTQRAHLLRHMVLHTGKRPFKCPMCPYASSDSSTLRRHRLRHVNVPPGRPNPALISCSQIDCHYQADRPSRIIRHVHSDFHGRFVSEKTTIVKHTRAEHSGHEKFDCAFCDFSSQSRCSLKTHLIRCHAPRPDCSFENAVKQEEETG